MTSDNTPIPSAPTPRTHAQKAAIWGATAIEDDPDAKTAYLSLHTLHAAAAALLAPDSASLPDEICVCGHERLYHRDRWDDELIGLDIGKGTCASCNGCREFEPVVA